jgi:hypothetical protein
MDSEGQFSELPFAIVPEIDESKLVRHVIPFSNEEYIGSTSFFYPTPCTPFDHYRKRVTLHDEKVPSKECPRNYVQCQCGLTSAPTKEPSLCETCRFYNAPRGLMEPIVFMEKYHVDDYEVKEDVNLLKIHVPIKKDDNGKILHGFFKYLKFNEVSIKQNYFSPFYTITKTAYFDGCEVVKLPMNEGKDNQGPNYQPNPDDFFRLYLFRDPQRKFAIHMDYVAKRLKAYYAINEKEEYLQIVLNHNIVEGIKGDGPIVNGE